MIIYDSVEWYFYHWDNQQDRDSDITTIIRSNSSSSVNTFHLPNKIAHELENTLEEKCSEEQNRKIKEHLKNG
jgi:hypoxanthine phosphoribosyltransferase